LIKSIKMCRLFT